VVTSVGPVQIDVPRDRNASFEPKIVAKRQKRLTDADEVVISLAAKGLTIGEIAARPAEVYGAQVSKSTICSITEKVIEGMAGRTGRWIRGGFYRSTRHRSRKVARMPKYAPNWMATEVRSRYFELIRRGMKGAAAARLAGVSTSCGSLWYIEAGSMVPCDKPVSSRFLTQDERIVIAEAVRTDPPVAVIAEQLGKHRSTICDHATARHAAAPSMATAARSAHTPHRPAQTVHSQQT